MTIIISILILFFGYTVSSLLSKDAVVRLGLGFLLGPMVISILMFLMHILFGIPFSWVMIAILIALLILSQIFSFKSFISDFTIIRYKFIDIFKSNTVILSIIIGIILYTFLHNLFWPPSTWDAITLYDYRAKYIVENITFLSGIQLNDGGYFYQYPPFTSLLHIITYLSGSNYPMYWYSILYVGFTILFYKFLSEKISPTFSLIGSLIIMTIPIFFEHATIAYTNLSYSIYFISGLLWLWKWLESKRTTDLLLGTFLLSTTTWIRETEPFWIIGIPLILFGLFKVKNKAIIIVSILILLLSSQAWDLYVSHLYGQNPLSYYTNTLEQYFPNSETIKANQVHTATIQINNDSFQLIELIDYVNTYIVLPYWHFYLLILVSIICFRKEFDSIYRNNLVVWLTLILITSIIAFGIYKFSLSVIFWKSIGGSATRMSMFLPILFVYVTFSSFLWKTKE